MEPTRPRSSSIQHAIFNHNHDQQQYSQPINRQLSTTLKHSQHPSQQSQADELDLLQVLDPAVNAASTLTHIRNCIFLPPMINHLGKPTIQLDGNQQSTQSELDSHLISILSHHPRPTFTSQRIQQLKRLFKGLKAFISTPIGIIFTIYGFLVVFWGAALVLILLGWLKITPQKNYRIWVEICSQILNGLFTIPGIGLFPSRIIDCWNIAVIVHHARVIWKRQGRKNLEDPNDLIPPKPPSSNLLPPRPPPSVDLNHDLIQRRASQEEKTTHQDPQLDDNPDETDCRAGQVIVVHEDDQEHEEEEQEEEEGSDGLPDVWKDEQEIVLNKVETCRLRRSQEALCRSQTWYRPHSSATHYAFPVHIALIIVILNLGNSLFQAALCAVMWGLRYSTRPAWTTATFMALSFSCGITSGILVWRIGLKTSKRTKVVDEVNRMIDPSSTSKLEPMAAEREGGEVAQISDRVRPAVHHHFFQAPPSAREDPLRPPTTSLNIRTCSVDPSRSIHIPPPSSSFASNHSHSLIGDRDDTRLVGDLSSHNSLSE